MVATFRPFDQKHILGTKDSIDTGHNRSTCWNDRLDNFDMSEWCKTRSYARYLSWPFYVSWLLDSDYLHFWLPSVLAISSLRFSYVGNTKDLESIIATIEFLPTLSGSNSHSYSWNLALRSHLVCLGTSITTTQQRIVNGLSLYSTPFTSWVLRSISFPRSERAITTVTRRSWKLRQTWRW